MVAFSAYPPGLLSLLPFDILPQPGFAYGSPPYVIFGQQLRHLAEFCCISGSVTHYDIIAFSAARWRSVNGNDHAVMRLTCFHGQVDWCTAWPLIRKRPVQPHCLDDIQRLRQFIVIVMVIGAQGCGKKRYVCSSPKIVMSILKPGQNNDNTRKGQCQYHQHNQKKQIGRASWRVTV